jgi:plastocyanin
MGRLWLPLAILTGSLTGATQHTVHEIRLTGRFVPNVIEARAGDSLRFVLTSGGPHNVEFVKDSIPAPMRTLLESAMPGEKIGPLSSPLLISAGETYAFKIPNLEPGRYAFVCLPHVSSNMRGALVIVR